MDTQRSRSAPRTVRPVAFAALGIAAISVALVSIVTLGGHGGNGAVVVPPSSATPSAPVVAPAPSVRPTTAPTPRPSDDGEDAMPITVDLRNATDADVRVDIVDHTGLLVGAASGTPGDGASVEGDTVKVENLDADTLELTWIDYPIDNALALYIDRIDGHIRLVLVQPAPTGATDSIGFDRALVLSFSEQIPASEVETFIQDGLDTPG